MEDIPAKASDIRIAVDQKLRELKSMGVTVVTYPEQWVLDDEMTSDDEDDSFMHVYIPEKAIYSSNCFQ